MKIHSRLQAAFEHGVRLVTTIIDADITTFVVLAEPDLESIADFVPRDLVEGGADIHVGAVDGLDDAQDQLDTVLDNVNPGDVAVFFCADEGCWNAALDLLGLPLDDIR